MIRPIIDDKTIEQLRAIINGVQRIAITCHKSPDGDALGSSLALCHVFRRLGKEAVVVTPDMAPRALEFIPGVRDIIVLTKYEQRARRALTDAQVIFCLDYNSLHRIDRLGEKFDPNLENAVMQGDSSEGEPGTVCAVLQKGYKLGDYVLRHAMVKVVSD